VPILDDERQNECDQQEIEEIQHVADRRRGEYLPLVDGELFLPLQMFEHRALTPTLSPQAGRGSIGAWIYEGLHFSRFTRRSEFP